MCMNYLFIHAKACHSQNKDKTEVQTNTSQIYRSIHSVNKTYQFTSTFRQLKNVFRGLSKGLSYNFPILCDYNTSKSRNVNTKRNGNTNYGDLPFCGCSLTVYEQTWSKDDWQDQRLNGDLSRPASIHLKQRSTRVLKHFQKLRSYWGHRLQSILCIQKCGCTLLFLK